ncbi:MAG: NUDIX domain-containing protein [Rhodospirillaceae bacterium]|nr:MAG: NUDIX domain-containing protein [Rhodospirillaceae bacterium]
MAKPEVGVGIVILRSNHGCPEVLLIRRGQPPRKGKWSIPGGRQELGETVREAAIREAREETSVEISDLRLIDVVDLVTRGADGTVETHWALVDFRAKWTGGEAIAGSDAADTRWVPLSDLDSYDLWGETLRVIRVGAEMRPADAPSPPERAL